jgi:hypothetical protein
MRPIVTMRSALSDPDLFGKVFAGESWAAWRVLLIAICGEALTSEERTVFEASQDGPRSPGSPSKRLGLSKGAAPVERALWPS